MSLVFRSGNIKTTLGMERLSCQTHAMAIEEIWIYLLASNLIRLMMAQAALLAHRLPRQLSFKQAVQIWVAWAPQATASTTRTSYTACSSSSPNNRLVAVPVESSLAPSNDDPNPIRYSRNHSHSPEHTSENTGTQRS